MQTNLATPQHHDPIERARVGSAFVTRSGVVCWADREFSAILGRTPSMLVGHALDEWVLPAASPNGRAKASRRCLLPDGSVVRAHMHRSIAFGRADRAAPEHVVLVTHDSTDDSLAFVFRIAPTDVTQLLTRIAARWNARRPRMFVRVGGAPSTVAWTDADRLAQALGYVFEYAEALDAPHVGVSLHARQHRVEVTVELAGSGPGSTSRPPLRSPFELHAACAWLEAQGGEVRACELVDAPFRFSVPTCGGAP